MKWILIVVLLTGCAAMDDYTREYLEWKQQYGYESPERISTIYDEKGRKVGEIWK